MLSRVAGDVHWCPARKVERCRRAAPVRGDLQMVATAKQRADLIGRDVGVGRHHLADLMRPDPDVECPFAGSRGNLLERLAIDVGDEIAETIDAQNLTDDAVFTDLRARHFESMYRSGRPSQH